MVSIFVVTIQKLRISSAFLNGEYLLFFNYFVCLLLSGKNINHKLLKRIYSEKYLTYHKLQYSII